MTHSIKVTPSKKFMVVDGMRVGITINTGPWIAGVNPDMIKLWPRGSNYETNNYFPKQLKEVFAIKNDSVMQEDYFSHDEIKLFPGMFGYDVIKQAVKSA